MVKVVSLSQEIKLSTTNNARSVALKTLIRVFENNSYSNISLNNSLKNSDLSIADQNLATKIVYGTIQYKIYLEYQLKDLIKVKIKESYLKPLLLMSVYQIVFLDKVPNRAVLDEANKLAKQFGKKRSSGFRLVNGILRSFIRRGKILPNSNDLIEYLSVKESFPIWLVKYFIDQFGQEKTENILASFNKNAKNSVRISSLIDKQEVLDKLKKESFKPKLSSLTSQVAILDHGGISETDLFEDGKITIQDEAASLVVDSFKFSKTDQVLDACSAPGGKTIQIAEKIPEGQVTALDIHKNKLNLVVKNAQRMHVADRVKTKAVDARKSDEYFSGQEFDKILVDAPCSGLGLMRRKPEIRYTKSKKDLVNLQKIQLSILDHVSQLLKKNGELVYSTCTISIEEDENVVQKFLEAHPNFELQPFNLEKVDSKIGTLKIMPDEYDSDGFFIAKFKLRG